MSSPTPVSYHPSSVTPSRFVPRFFRFVVLGLLVVILIACVGAAWFFYTIKQIPADFPSETVVTIDPGSSARTIGRTLESVGVIESAWLFYLVLHLFDSSTNLQAGTYTFSEPANYFGVIEKIASGDVTRQVATITHIEGDSAVKLAARLVDSELTNFDPIVFRELTESLEGRLFPDTYYVEYDLSTAELVALMTETFAEKIAPLSPQMASSTLSLDEIIILASILEREANTPDSMKMVSGILQNRLRIGMALQVDASIEYVLGKELKDLTPEDLKRDTPYNTYLYPGLPPTPIGNPGLEAITAILEPTPSDYLFYITGNDGKFYYGRDFDEHRLNIARHLR